MPKAWSLIPPSLPSRERVRERPLVKGTVLCAAAVAQASEGMVVDAGAPYMVKNRDTVVRAATATANTQPSKGAGGRLCQGYVTRAAIAAIAQASKRMAVNQGTAVCSTTAAIVQASKGMVIDAGALYLALGDGTTSGEGVRIEECNGIVRPRSVSLQFHWVLARPQAWEVWLYPRAAEEQRACWVI